MKNLLTTFFAMILSVGVLCVQAWAQQSAPQHSAPRISLLVPSALKEQAPATFRAKFTTTKGDFVVEVTRAWAPLGAARFYNLV